MQRNRQIDRDKNREKEIGRERVRKREREREIQRAKKVFVNIFKRKIIAMSFYFQITILVNRYLKTLELMLYKMNLPSPFLDIPYKKGLT